ncbi:MAG TPA: helix-turn-helix domain-containing protein [Gemmatimonadaceae bacterium]|nr:helix-turn-helix domain-containing protein [Gemmatimonadaceae bacterium]
MLQASRKPDGPTRAQILALLRRGQMTVDELAEAVGITDNAVRLHLAALERDGLVRSVGVRREGSVGKPATLYAVAPEAEAVFSKAYEPVLTTLLVTLAGRLGERELSDLLRDVGRQLAATSISASATLEHRVRAAATVLDALGADTEVEQAGVNGFVVRGFACPLSRSVAQCPPLCGAVEELVAGITKAKVQEKCDRSEAPRCSFIVTPKAGRSRS